MAQTTVADDQLTDDLPDLALVGSDPEIARQVARRLDRLLKQQVRADRERWLKRARIVAAIKRYELWRHLPQRFRSFNDWSAQPDLDLAPSVRSDMLAVSHFGPILASVGIDLEDAIRRAGHARVRRLIPQIREAEREARRQGDPQIIADQLGPLFEAIDDPRFGEVLEMGRTRSVRARFEPEIEAIAQQGEDSYLVSLRVDAEGLEIIGRRLGLGEEIDDALEQDR